MIKEKNCSVCGDKKELFNKSIFCKSCTKQISLNIMSILVNTGDEALGGTPVIRAVSRRLYEKHYEKFQEFQCQSRS